MSLLDLIYPKRCVGCGVYSSYLCSKCFAYITFANHGYCVACQRNTIDGLTHPGCRSKYEIDGVFASVTYSGVVKRLIHQFKYSPYILDLRNLLSDLFYEGIIQNELFSKLLAEKCAFVPIPLHRNRILQRGYNQSHVLAEGLLKRLKKESFRLEKNEKNLIVMTELLQRPKQTRPQFGLSQKDRLENMSGAFSVKPNLLVNMNQRPVVFLIDDILTTGATFREAGRILRRAGLGRIYGVALAHGQ